MYKRLTAAFAVMLCLALLTAFGMTASATGEGDGESQPTSSAVSSTEADSSEASSSTDTSSSEVSDGEQSSSELSSSSDSSSSSDTSSETDSESSDSSDASSENSSSGTTSSRPHNTIHSGGNYRDDHFIPQDFTSSTSSQDSAASSNTDSTSSDVTSYTDSADEEQYKGKAVSLADGIYKYLWIPVVIALLCIGGLVAVNAMFRKKYPKAGKGSHGTHSSSSHDGPHRRRKR